MTESIVSICNRALGKLGQDVTIVSLSENSKAGRAFSRTWEPVRDYVLASAVWPFAIRARALALSAQSPHPGWRFAYDYPDDCLDALAVMGEDGVRPYMRSLSLGLHLPARDFEKAHGNDGTILVTDHESAWLVYSSVVEDVSRFPPLFVDALVTRLAAENAAALAGEVGLRMRPALLQEFEYARNLAAVHGMNESAAAPLAYETPALVSRL